MNDTTGEPTPPRQAGPMDAAPTAPPPTVLPPAATAPTKAAPGAAVPMDARPMDARPMDARPLAPPFAEPTPGKSLRREAFWLLPIGITSIGTTLFMLLNMRWGADASAILAFPVSLAGIVVAILMERGAFKTTALRVPRGRRRTWRWMAALIAVILAGTTTAWWLRREGNPFDYLSGNVRIGFTSAYLGWHADSTGTPVGFDVDVAREIQRHFRIEHITWVDVGKLDNRFAALKGKWRDGSGAEQAPVKLVVSTFSMTPARAEQIDFAGPYFVDSQGFLSRSTAETIADIPRGGTVCVLQGSTAAERLVQYGWRPVEQPSVAACVSDYKTGAVDAVSADRSTLAGYARSVGQGQKPPIGLNIGAEKYGVGMPNNMPRLCAEISKVLDDFLTYQWSNAFKTNLQPIGLNEADYIAPRSTDPCESSAPWYGG